MRMTLEDLEKYSDTITTNAVKVQWEAKVRIGSTLKTISKTYNLAAFKHDVAQFLANFPAANLMLSKTEMRV